MIDKFAAEERQAAQKHVNDYYPDIVRYHQNELLSFFDSVNSDYLVDRKTRLNKVQTADGALAYIREARASFSQVLGDIPGGGAGSTRIFGSLDKGRYRIDRVLIESLPGYFLSANFYYPKDSKHPSPAILFLCGHSQEGKAYPMYVSFCVEAVLNGFCVLTFDPVGQGERRMYDTRDSEHFTGSPDAVHYLLGQQAWLAGSSITAYMMRDNIAALEYLCSRPEADGSAVAVAGNSGGGQMAAFMGAYDSRIIAVVSSCYITELASMIHHIGAQECEQSLPGFMEAGLGLADLMIAAAPKPYFIGASLMDFFPIDGTRDAYIDARRVYRLLDCGGNLEINIAPKPHGFWHESREKALRFLCRHFALEFAEDKDIDYDNLPAEKELFCTTGGDIAECDTTTLRQILEDRAGADLPALPDAMDASGLVAYGEDVRLKLLDVLKIDLANIKADIVCSAAAGSTGAIRVTDYSLLSEEHMKIYATLYETGGGQKEQALLHVGRLEPGDKALEGFLAEYPAVFCVETRGTGRGAFEPGCFFYPPAFFENEEASMNCNAEMLGRSIAGMRVADVLSAARLLNSMQDYRGCRLTLGGSGEDALTALYTAVLLGGRDLRITDLLYSFMSLLRNRMYTWGSSTFVSGMLRSADVPGLLAALAGNHVQIDGLLDNMKRRLTCDESQGFANDLREIFAAAGGSLSIL